MDTVARAYELWSTSAYFDTATRAELQALQGNATEIADRFYRHLEFGTGGLRGLLGAGTNRINRYTVRHATQGLADDIRGEGEAAVAGGVVIAHDSRRGSAEFAQEAALTLAAHGIAAYLWDSLRPTPLLSFAVRRLGATAGIVITASHNPPAYNGFKVYGSDGGQVPPERAAAIQARMRAIDDIRRIRPLSRKAARRRGLLRTVPPDVDREYIARLVALVCMPREQRAAVRILYTPLHGSGCQPVRQALTAAGFPFDLVPAQAEPDGAFSTVRTPNPEEPEVFALALQQARAERPDVIMATDPDADRLGVYVRDGAGEYRRLTGNQVGALLVDYLLRIRQRSGTLPANSAVLKTIATSNLVAATCARYGVALVNTHTGFKFIGDRIREYEQTGEHTFLFGFEESYGYLGASFVRDKDAVMAALLVADAAAFFKAQGLTLAEALERLFASNGYFREGLYGFTFPGQHGQAQMAALMSRLRAEPPAVFAGLPVQFIDDYQAGTTLAVTSGVHRPLPLEPADVLHYRFADGGFVLVRPSGTEPKLKLYVSVVGADAQSAEARLEAVSAAARRLIEA